MLAANLSVHSHSPSLTSEANVTDLKVPIVFTAALLLLSLFVLVYLKSFIIIFFFTAVEYDVDWALLLVFWGAIVFFRRLNGAYIIP